METQSTCKHCNNHYNKKELTRSLGKESSVVLLGYCSSQCYTKSLQEREKSMEWWNKLSYTEKFEFIVKYKTQIVDYPHTNPDRLTGSEIEKIYKQEKK